MYSFHTIPILWPSILWHNRAMDKEKIEAMVTKFSEKFAIIMLKRRGLTHFDATPIFKKSFRYIWVTLYLQCTVRDIHNLCGP